MTARFSRLEALVPIVDEGRRPSSQFQRFYQKFLEALEGALAGIEDVNEAQEAAILAIVAAQAAAAAAQAAADAAGDAAADAAGDATTANASISSINTLIANMRNGTSNFTAIRVGGQRFIYDGVSALVPG